MNSGGKGIGPVERDAVIRLSGGVRRVDVEQELNEKDVADLPPVEFENLKLGIPRGGVELQPMGVGKLIRPMIDVDKANQIKNPVGRKFVQGSSWLLDKLHSGINYVYAAIAAVDSYIFKKGLDQVTGLNNVDDNVATHLRWGERAAATTLGIGAYKGLRARSAMAGLRGAGGFWKGAWPVGLMLYLSQTKVASNLEEGAGLAALGGALILLNYPTNTAYRSVITPESAKPMALKWGLAFGLSHFALNYYWDNFSAQSRILPAVHSQPAIDAYKPWKWDWDYTQAKTTYSHSIGWGLGGSAWGMLLHWQTDVINRASTRLFGVGKAEILAIKPGTASYRFVNEGVLSQWKAGRGLKAFLASFTPRRFAYTVASTAVGLPLGIALGRLTFEAQDFSTVEAVTGTPARAVLTAPLSTAGVTACATTFGVSHPWCAYAFNMYPVNWRWQAEAQQGEILYQVAKKLADDYKKSDDTNEKRHIATNLFNLHRASLGKAKRKDEESEKARIGVLLADAGLDVYAIEQAAIRYASPQPE